MSACFEAQKYSRNQQPFHDLIEAIITKAFHSHYDHLYRSYSTTVAKHVSKRERREKDLSSNRSLIYGEIEYEGFRRILDRIHVWSQTSISERQKWTFYDLGSGMSGVTSDYIFTYSDSDTITCSYPHVFRYGPSGDARAFNWQLPLLHWT